MTVREDALRALEYGKSAYYQHIINLPSYQNELARVRQDYNERTWIDFTGFYPKFTTEDFEERRKKYQEKYGNEVNIPGFSDIIHIIPKARISAEERAAHLWASKRGLPSPLNPDQLQALQYKKFRFLKALASATPTWIKNIGAAFTVLDNVEDALVTISVLGKIAARVAPRLLGRTVPILGWILMGSDILNVVNLFSWATVMTRGCKKLNEDMAAKNPFHAKAAANRATRLKKTLPGFGEYLEILQTTDQLFGVGVCLGGLMGIVTDLSTKVMTYSAQEKYAAMPKMGNADEITRWAYKNFAADVTKFKHGLQDQWTNFKNEAYRLREIDIKLRNDIFAYAPTVEGIVKEKLKSIPETAYSWFSNSLIGQMIISTEKDTYLNQEHTNAYMMTNSAIQGLMPWWIENQPLESFVDLRSFQFRAPEPTDPNTIETLNEVAPQWQNTVLWPHLNKEYATIEEIAYAYAPLIKDSFQTYCLNHQHEYDAMVAAGECVEFTKNVIRSFSDDNYVRIGYTAYVAAAIDMMDQVYVMEPDTPQSLIDQLADYIGGYERTTNTPPKIHDLARYSEQIGIKWMRSFPIEAFEEVAEQFPEWAEIQRLLEEIYVTN